MISRQKGGGVRSFFCHRLGYLRGIKIEKGNLRWWSVVIEIERIKKKGGGGGKKAGKCEAWSGRGR